MAGNKYISSNSGVLAEVTALQSSTGATDAGKIVALDDNGKLDASLGLGDKVDKVTGKGLSTNDFTDTLKTLLELKKVKDVTTDAVNDKLVITYTDDTVANLNINDIVTNVYVSGATLDATTNVLTLTSTSGGADVTVNLSDFVNSSELTSALADKVSKVTSTDGAIVAFSGINGDVKDSLFTIADLKTYIGKAGFSFISTDLLKVGTTNVNWDGGVVPTGKVGTAKLSGLAGAVVGTWNNSVRRVGITDIEITDYTKGVILKSPNGTRYKITIADDGALISTAV